VGLWLLSWQCRYIAPGRNAYQVEDTNELGSDASVVSTNLGMSTEKLGKPIASL
jgi:hypothetical protein